MKRYEWCVGLASVTCLFFAPTGVASGFDDPGPYEKCTALEELSSSLDLRLDFSSSGLALAHLG